MKDKNDKRNMDSSGLASKAVSRTRGSYLCDVLDKNLYMLIRLGQKQIVKQRTTIEMKHPVFQWNRRKVFLEGHDTEAVS